MLLQNLELFYSVTWDYFLFYFVHFLLPPYLFILVLLLTYRYVSKAVSKRRFN